MQITGKIIDVLPMQGGISQKTGNEWKVQGYVIEETGAQYPTRVYFEVIGADKINGFAIKQGEELTVQFDIKAQSYNGKWYNRITAWQVARGAAPQPQQPAPAPQPQPQAQQPQETGGDLPF